MIDSILTSIKKILGIPEDYADFDLDVMMCINTVLNILTQIGVGPLEGFTIRSDNETWTDFVGTDKRLEMVKNYVSIKVRLLWDPPQNSFLLENLKDQAKELEWRLNVQVDPPTTFQN